MRLQDGLPDEEFTLYRGAITFNINPSILTDTNTETEQKVFYRPLSAVSVKHQAPDLQRTSLQLKLDKETAVEIYIF